MEDYLVLLEEAKKLDHSKLGRELELFMFSDTMVYSYFKEQSCKINASNPQQAELVECTVNVVSKSRNTR